MALAYGTELTFSEEYISNEHNPFLDKEIRAVFNVINIVNYLDQYFFSYVPKNGLIHISHYIYHLGELVASHQINIYLAW